MAKQKVYVYETGDLLVKYRVYPAVTILNKNDEVELVNTTNDDASWVVPAGLLEDEGSNQPVPKHGRRSKVAKKDGPRGAAYEVFVDGTKAHAHSDPVIIIDD